MKRFIWFLPSVVFLYFSVFSNGYTSSKNVSARPAVVNIGALFTFDSIIGRVAKIAIEEAVRDVNSNSRILHGTKLNITMQNSNASGLLGMLQAFQFMENEVVAIIGPQSSTVAHIVSYVANELKVPLLAFGVTDPTLTPLEFPFFVRTTQSDSYQMTAVAEIVSYYGWKAVVAIFVDNEYGRNGVTALHDKLAERRCRISYKSGIPPESGVNWDYIMDLLIKVALIESRVIVLHVSPSLGLQIFSVAKYLEMMGNGYAWIATDWLACMLDSASLPSDTIDTMQGILVLRQHIPESDRKRDFLSRWNNLIGGSLGMNSYGLYAYDSVWLLAHAIDSFFNQGGKISFSNDSRLKAMKGGNLHFDSMSIFDDGMLLLNNIVQQNNLVGLTGPLKFNSDRSLTHPAYDIINVIGTGFRRIGYWSNYTGLSKVCPETLYTKPPNCSSASQQLYSVIWPGETLSKPRGWVFPNSGKLLKIGVPLRVTYNEFVSKEKETGMFQGFCIDVFTAAVNLLPYAVPYQFVAFGDGHKNPSYTELVNSITTGVFDAVVGDVAIVPNRTNIVDFTQPYAASGLVVVVPFRELNTGAWTFLLPFSPLMWTVGACSVMVVGIVVWILEHRINDEFRGPPTRQVSTILWFSLSTLFFAHKENTISILGRLVLLVWLFVVFITNSSYTASLTSILTTQQLYSPIKGIDSLRESDDPIGYQVGSFAESYLFQQLNISKSRLVALGTPEEYAKALEDGPGKGGVAAIVDEYPYVELFLSSHCSFRVVGQEFTISSWGFAFPRDSPLAVDMSTAILELAENGDLQRMNDKWLGKSRCNLESAEIESDRLHFSSFWGLFLIIGVACFIALLIYFLQIMQPVRKAAPSDSISNAISRHGDDELGRSYNRTEADLATGSNIN